MSAPAFARAMIGSAVLLALGLATPGSAAGQDSDEPLNLQWYHPVIAGAGVATLMLVDVPVRDYVQDHTSGFGEDVADFTKEFKNPPIYYGSAGGAILIGLVADEPAVTRTGFHIITAWGLSSAMMIGTKWAFGRSRPWQTDDAMEFDWLDGGQNSAFPSGSAAVVFSLATTLSDAIDRRPVSIVLYSGATLNAWARMHSNRHWLSDVALGAIYGITAAKLVNGEWTVFGAELPQVWTDGQSAGLGYSIRF